MAFWPCWRCCCCIWRQCWIPGRCGITPAACWCASAPANRAGSLQQARLEQFRQAVQRSGSITELQGQLAAIQAPPLSAADQRLSLPALKADMLSQIKAQQTSLRQQAGPRVPIDLLIKDSLRVLLLAPLLAYAFAMGRRITPPPLPDPFLP